MKKFLIFILPLIYACATPHGNKNIVASNPEENSFLYMIFGISRDTIDNTTQITLKSKKEIVGFVKSTNESYVSKNFLQFLFVDKSNKVISTQILDHPLFYRAETLNESEQLVTRMVELDNAEFVLRVNKTDDIYKLIIKENIENKSPKNIYETSHEFWSNPDVKN